MRKKTAAVLGGNNKVKSICNNHAAPAFLRRFAADDNGDEEFDFGIATT